jgi:hypothetical protein
MDFYVLSNGKQIGPLDESALISSWRAAVFTKETLVWTQGLDEWTPLEKLIVVEPSVTPRPVLAAIISKWKVIERKVAPGLADLLRRACVRCYDVQLPNGAVMLGLTAEQIIAKCQAREIASKTKIAELGWLLRSYRPIREFPEFAPYVRDTTPEEAKREAERKLEEAECNPEANAQCYLQVDGKRQGPFLPAQIRAMWNAGTITANTLFIHSDLPDWRPASSFCQHAQWQENQSKERSKEVELLKQIVAAQRKTSARLWGITVILFIVFVLPFLIYQCTR